MDRRRVFKLLATGRITAAEAEKLMSAWQASRESSWILAGCIGIALAQAVGMLGGSEWAHLARAMISHFA